MSQHGVDWRADEDSTPHNTTLNFLIIKGALNFMVNLFWDVIIFRRVNTFEVQTLYFGWLTLEVKEIRSTDR